MEWVSRTLLAEYPVCNSVQGFGCLTEHPVCNSVQGFGCLARMGKSAATGPHHFRETNARRPSRTSCVP
eukprot:1904230-Prymnesium_polylepis.1